MQLPNWIELDGRLVNLDNICFISRISPTDYKPTEYLDVPARMNDYPERTAIAFIGGQSMEFNLTRDETIKLIQDHFTALNTSERLREKTVTLDFTKGQSNGQ